MRSRTIGFLLGVFALPLFAANWPTWRGENALGVAKETKLPLKWSATENVVWSVPLPERGNSTPVVWKDKVFVTQTDGDRRTVMCFDRKFGKTLWQSGTSYGEKEETHETNPYCSASPVTDGERVIAWFGSAGVFAYDMNGKELWKVDLGKQTHTWGFASSPVIHGDVCVMYFGPGERAFLLGLDKRSGKELWRVKDPPIAKRPRTDGFRGQADGIVGSFSSPILVEANGRTEVVMSYPQLICAYDPKTGKELWRCDGLNELLYGSPIAGEGVVVAMGGFQGTTISVKAGGSGDVTATHRLWQQERTENRLGSGVIHDGHIYILNTPGIAECIDLKTGKVVWEERVKGAGPKSESWSSMVLAGDRIYVLNQSGDTVVLKASPKFEVLAANAIENELTNASHAMSDGQIFIRTHKRLWCIGETARTASLK